MQHHHGAADALASVLPLGGDGQTPLLCLYERDNRQQWDNPHDVRTQGKSETLVQKEGLVKGARALAVKGAPLCLLFAPRRICPTSGSDEILGAAGQRESVCFLRPAYASSYASDEENKV